MGYDLAGMGGIQRSRSGVGGHKMAAAAEILLYTPKLRVVPGRPRQYRL